ncbi:glycosyltransferase [Paenibacillus luteus]|uniref:glycosyltransferase n=1 Tax=Paenibacillus luteus TaxID=2545753 RepID=UPI0013762265|nr:glycosyltransferase [Paenibacillus luteus]
MKKIMIFTSGYLPGKRYGGPVVSINNFVNLCGDDFEIYIVTTNHDFKENIPYRNIQENWNIVGKSRVMYYADKDFNYNKINNTVNSINPDVIYLNSFFNAKFVIPILLLTKMKKRNVLVAPRGEFFPSALNQKRIKKTIYLFFMKKILLNKNTLFQATTEVESEQIKTVLNINSNKIFLLENLPSLPMNLVEKNKKIEGCLKLIYIARIHSHKNLNFALQCLNEIKGDVTFNIYGPIEQSNYWESCNKIINELPRNINVNYCGIAEREDIHRLYSENDAMILPTLSENYGHSIVEAMLSGCPIVISNNTPWTDVNEANAGWALSLSKKQDFIFVIQKLVDMDDIQYEALVINLNKYIQIKTKTIEIKQKYLSVFSNFKADNVLDS